MARGGRLDGLRITRGISVFGWRTGFGWLVINTSHGDHATSYLNDLSSLNRSREIFTTTPARDRPLFDAEQLRAPCIAVVFYVIG